MPVAHFAVDDYTAQGAKAAWLAGRGALSQGESKSANLRFESEQDGLGIA
jgi:hypothetical protein